MSANNICRTPGIGITGLPNSIRVPATDHNRAYLKLLRSAEDARWKSAGMQGVSPYASLPSVGSSRAEDWLLQLVGVISLATLGYAIMDSARLVESWSAFTDWVKFAIGA